MATYYLDYEGGNDSNAGTSFATRWKTITNGAIASRIAPGDTIRIMASPNPTSIGNAKWTGGGRPAAINITSASNASPIVITTSVAHGLSTGDYVSVTGVSSNANAIGVWKVGTVGSATTFEILQMDGSNTTGIGVGTGGNVTNVSNCMVELASPVTQNIALCGGIAQKPFWQASLNVGTAQLTTTFKEGYSCASINITASFTTGKAAWYTLPSTLDLSGYQQVSFWVRLQSGTVGAAGSVYLALCTDTTGDTVAHQCPIPALGRTTVWVPVTVNLGTNLSSAIRSVAFYVVTDNGAQNFYLDNIIACKAASSADSLNITSLVSKSDGTGDEAWYAIQSINYNVIMLANENVSIPSSTNIRGYTGTSETVTTYKRETIKTIPVSSSTIPSQTVQDSGTAASPITFSGGWNRTDMSTQTGQTWFDGQNGNGYGILQNNNSYITFDKINYCRYGTGLFTAGACNGSSVISTYATANTSGVYSASNIYSFGDVWVSNNSTGIAISGAGIYISNIKTCLNNTAVGAEISAFQTTIDSFSGGNTGIVSSNSAIAGAVCDAVIGTATFTANPICPAIRLGSNGSFLTINGGSSTGSLNTVTIVGSGAVRFNNFTMNEATEVAALTLGRAYVYSNRHDNTDGNSWQWQGTGTINQQTSVVDGPATSSWKMNPTTANATAVTPLWLKLGTVVCAAGSLVTVTARMRRDNTGLTMRLICPGGQISGVSSDVFSDMTAAADTWETVTITFTPTKPGGVDIYAYAFGGTTYSGYVCNLTASQA